MPKVNPDILRWARKSAGLTLEEACKKLRLRDARGVSAVDRLAALEAGENEPTRPMLVKMAKKYRRPLVTFYMSTHPRSGDRGQDFRTLPDEYPADVNALVDALVREIQARQSIIRAALEDEEEAIPLSFIGSMKISDGVPALTNSIVKTIDFDLPRFRKQRSTGDAFAYLRACVESNGVYVILKGDLGSYHSAIDLQAFRGFALADEVAPFIVINDKDSRAAWSFTLLHELTHLWLGQTGVSGANSEKSIERFCNEVASSTLLDKQELRQLEVNDTTSFEISRRRITEFAYARNLSSSMVAYNLFVVGAISNSTWHRLSASYRQQWLENRTERRSKLKEKSGGPDYYIVRRHRVGTHLITLVQRMMATGTLTTSKAGKALGVRAINVQKLIEADAISKTDKAV